MCVGVHVFLCVRTLILEYNKVNITKLRNIYLDLALDARKKREDLGENAVLADVEQRQDAERWACDAEFTGIVAKYDSKFAITLFLALEMRVEGASYLSFPQPPLADLYPCRIYRYYYVEWKL